jgi:hypothetical protein
MKKLFILPIALLLILMSSCKKDEKSGSSSIVSQYRTVPTFNKVSSDGIFDLVITQGSEQSVEIIANDNIINEVETEVVDNELRLFLDEDFNYTNIQLQANIVVPNIYGIKNVGAGNVLIVNVSNDQNFNVYNSGAGNISIEGSAQGLTIENEGSGKIQAFTFPVDNCDVQIIGSGDCEVNVALTLDVEIDGSGNVYYIGSPEINTNILGSGEVIDSN